QATDENNRIIQAAIGGTSYSNSYEYILYANGTVGNRGHSGIDLSSLNNVTQVAAAHNGYFGAAVKADGTVWSWGDNANGQIGDGTSGTANNKTTPVQVGSGSSNAMNVRYGKIRNRVTGITRKIYNNPTEIISNVLLSEDEDLIIDSSEITISQSFSLLPAVSKTSAVLISGQIIDGRIADYYKDSEISDINSNNAGYENFSVIRPKGGIYGITPIVISDSNSGLSSLLRVSVHPKDGVAMPQVAAGSTHMIALKYDGTVWAWGNNNNGQLGNTSIGSSIASPIQVMLDVDGENNPIYLNNIVQVAAGTNFSAVLDRDGQVWTWGEGTDGKLGLGDTGNRQYPTKVSITDVVFITAGPRNMFAIRADGSLWAWGYSYSAQESSLGTNGGSTSVPTRVLGGASGSAYLSDVVYVTAGEITTYAIKSNG
ncbi:hypothetical protein FMM68_12685, partial [Lachnospiraceae bacterium MD329]|nr:hypothetical protein [Lachnospiraceae bacterium MD329]